MRCDRFHLVLAALSPLVLHGGALAQTPPTPAVIVMPVEAREITDQADFLGRIQAADKVELRARVEGFLTARKFVEGDRVAEGAVLFTIDRTPFEATVDQRKAELAAAEATQRNTEVQLERTRELAAKGNSPQATLDQRAAEDARAKADVLRAQAALRQADINLSWTNIVAPIAGRIGQAAVTPGNLVGPTTPPLATLVRTDPIYVTFPITQRELLAARRKAGGVPEKIVVRLRLADGTTYAKTGSIQLLDVAANQGTDSVTARAVFANPTGELIDGASVRVITDLGEAEKKLVVPSAAVSIDQQGAFVLVVGEGNKVEIKRPRVGGQRGIFTIVEAGLAAGDRIIVEGGQRVRPGMVVAPQVQPLPDMRS